VSDGGNLAVSLIRDDLFFRAQQAIGLVPRKGLGIGRRAAFYALVSWLPIAVWAAIAGRPIAGAVDEPLLQHFGVNVRCLIAIPLFVVAEGMAHATLQRLLPQFIRAGLVEDRAVFVKTLEGVARLRNRTLPWVVIAAVTLAWTVLAPDTHQGHDLLWAEQAAGPSSLGFGGWWYLYVARPIYLTLALAWLWRVVLTFVLFRRLAALPLSFVPTHPDRVGGLGFLESVPAAFALVILGFSAVYSAGWAHDVLYHGVNVTSLKVPVAGFLVLVAIIFLAPLVVFGGPLRRAKRAALLEYGALVADHGRMVHRRWIEKKQVEDDTLITAPEIGPVADVQPIYEAVQRMRTLPIGKSTLLAILVPALIPILVVVSLQVPIGEVLLKILKALS
jgi:uncharacterized membrane protein (DUF2068 family)